MQGRGQGRDDGVAGSETERQVAKCCSESNMKKSTAAEENVVEKR